MKKIKNFLYPLASRWGVLSTAMAIAIAFIVLIPSAYAQPVVTQSYPTIAVTPQGVVTSMCTVVNWLFYILMVLSVMMVLFAGYTFVTAGDDTEKVSKARKMITYAALGIVIALIAKGFPTLIYSFMTGQSASNLSC